ncbi:MAG: OmpA family protein [Cytophagales bacterium]|nr:OmpA family protein [Cytophagales bacterium]
MRHFFVAIFLVVFFFSSNLFAQNRKAAELTNKADRFFKVGKYSQALGFYLEAESLEAPDYLTAYAMGVCYFYKESVDQQVKGIKYLKSSLSSFSKGDVPSDVHLYLGELFMANEDVPLAIMHFGKYLGLIDKEKDPLEYLEIKKRLAQARVSEEIILNPKKIKIERLDHIVNSIYTEYNPVLSADESVLAYTFNKPEHAKTERRAEGIMITEKTSEGLWKEPKPIKIRAQGAYGTAGMSPDGQKMLVYIENAKGRGGNLYIIEKEKDGWSDPQIIDGLKTNNYHTTTGSFTADGNTIFFASDRPGGFGGKDIYKVTREHNGKWSTPVNLGSSVNSEANEDSPFIHPDSKTLFFTSNRTESIGGYDVFKALKIRGRWRPAFNLGYPINTTADESYFSMTADGSRSYFSSNRKGGYGEQDIYYFKMPESEANIPLTMVKGKILAGTDSLPVPTQIKVIDNETDKVVQFVYSPSKATGDYLIILPPGKNYDMLIESEGYMPYTVNINVPHQTYFFQLYQRIHLNPIFQFDTQVGQEVSVRNKFYDSHEEYVKTNMMKAYEASLIKSDSLDLYDMMDLIVKSSDTVAYNYLLELMYSTSPIENVQFDDSDQKLQIASRSYYYDESDTTKLIRREVEGEEVFSLPKLYVDEESRTSLLASKLPRVPKEALGQMVSIFFAQGSSEIASEDVSKLRALLNKMKQNEGMGVEISGYASSEGDAALNRQLSNKRAIKVLEIFNHSGIVRRRIKARAYGEESDSSAERARRVDVRLIDLETYGQKSRSL